MESSPWYLGFVDTVLRALARDDRAAMAVWVAPAPWPLRPFVDRVARIARRAAAPWCKEALAPWGDSRLPGPRSFAVRERGRTLWVRFSTRADQVLVLVIVRTPDAKVEDLRTMSEATFGAFGEAV